MSIVIVAGTPDDIRQGRGRIVLSVTQTAARLGVTERTVRRLVETAVLTPHEEKLANTPLFFEEDVERVRESRMRRGF